MPRDAKGLLRSAIDCDDPVICFEACPLWGMKEEVPDEEYCIPLGVAKTVMAGSDVTVVAISGAVPEAWKAAAKLAEDGVSVGLIDPRTMVPLDRQTILNSVAKAGRLVTAAPAHRTCGAAAENAAIVAEVAFDYLNAPIVRVTTPDIQIPFAPALEQQLYPNATKIGDAIQRVLQ